MSASQNSPKTKHRRRRTTTPPQDDVETITASLPLLDISSSPRMSQPTRLLVCSLGNPGRPYLNTIHSAGHTVLTALQPFLRENTSFIKSSAHGGGLLSTGPNITLYQSPSFMNISGPAIHSAWRTFVSRNPGADTKLIILHDELELALGKIKARPHTGSSRGHNGLKSIKAHFPKSIPYTQIGIGVGRPVSKEPDVVAAYVLRKMTSTELQKIEGCATDVEKEMRRIGNFEE